MTKKDFILIAHVIKRQAEAWKPESPQAEAVSNLAYDMACVLNSENERFDFDRFINACKPS